jgi:predicted amidophosphoribosyltransferase
MHRQELLDLLARWIDPEVLGLTELPMPNQLDARAERCVDCGASFAAADAASATADRCELPAGIDALISLGDYAGPAGQAARLIKGTCWTDGAWWWGSALGQRIAAWPEGRVGANRGAVCGTLSVGALRSDTVLVPVPGDRWRTVLRGIDHAADLARAASASCGLPWRSVLVRQDPTRQASRGAHKRRSIQGRFSIKPNVVSLPDRIVLVDDVCTTGSTGADCAQAIRRAGVTWVALGVLARAHQ